MTRSTAAVPASAPPAGGAEQPPYVHLRLVDGHPELRGLGTCLLGHRLERPGRERPGGIFAEWAWDGRRLVVRNDHYGIQPLYYFAREGEVALSPSIPTLVGCGAPRELDDSALAVFLRVGYFLGDETPLAAVRALPPAASLTWEAGRLELSGGPTLPRPARLSRDQAIDGFVELFRQAVRRSVPDDDDFVVALSGGLDSRHILLELCASGRPPRFCATYGPWWGQAAQDPPLAARVAAALGVEHVVLPVPGAWLPSELRKNRFTSFGSIRHAQYLTLVDYLRGRAGAIFDGFAGDVLLRYRLLTKGHLAWYRTGNWVRLARRMMLRNRNTHRVLPPEARARFSPRVAFERFKTAVKVHAAAPNPISSFAFWTVYRRELALAPFALYPAVGRPLTPFIDDDLFDFLSSLPAEHMLDHRFHLEALVRAYPEHSGIPEATWTLTTRRHWYVRRFCLELLGYLASAPSRLLDRRLAAFYLLRGVCTGDPIVDPRMIAYVLQLERLLAG